MDFPLRIYSFKLLIKAPSEADPESFLFISLSVVKSVFSFLFSSFKFATKSSNYFIFLSFCSSSPDITVADFTGVFIFSLLIWGEVLAISFIFDRLSSV